MSNLLCGRDRMFAQCKEMEAQIATGLAQAERGELIDEDARLRCCGSDTQSSHPSKRSLDGTRVMDAGFGCDEATK